MVPTYTHHVTKFTWFANLVAIPENDTFSEIATKWENHVTFVTWHDYVGIKSRKWKLKNSKNHDFVDLTAVFYFLNFEKIAKIAFSPILI